MALSLLSEEDVETIMVDKEDTKNLKKSLTGRFPVLELANGVVVAESLPIARVLAKSHASFLGQDEASRAQCDMWLDFINSNVVPACERVVAQCDGSAKTQMDMRAFSIATGELKVALASIENHLKLRNFLVGHSLTLADLLLVSLLRQAFTLAVDKKTRDSSLPNLNRYTTIVSGMPVFVSTLGEAVFCKDAQFKPAAPVAPKKAE